jgi:V8-like Glu-specific endopeptidase
MVNSDLNPHAGPDITATTDADEPNSDSTLPTTPELEPSPPDTVNPPRKITFDYRTNVDFDRNIHGGIPLDIEVGSSEDEEASQWLVVTSSGYEYDGSPEILREIFAGTNFSVTDLISKHGNSINHDLLEVGPGYDIRSKRTVFGRDGRRRVRSPRSVYPFSAMGHVDVGCTGTFIGPRHILTAGHCVYDYNRRQWEGNLNFRRGKDCNPNQGILYRWTRALSVQGWINRGLSAYDYGMIVVDRVYTRYMTYGYYAPIISWSIDIAGYPGDKPNGCMWRSRCRTITRNSNIYSLSYQCDTYGGMSGSAVYSTRPRSSRKFIHCIHAKGGDSTNSCTRITETKFGVLQRWIRMY